MKYSFIHANKYLTHGDMHEEAKNILQTTFRSFFIEYVN